jgi:hypothetical protein
MQVFSTAGRVISVVTTTLLGIVAFSYRQPFMRTQPAVARIAWPRRTSESALAAASLLVDYTLTVSGQHLGGRPRDRLGLPRPSALTALLIKGALLFRPNTVVTSVPFQLAR